MDSAIRFSEGRKFVHRLLTLTGIALLATSLVAVATHASSLTTWDPAGPVSFASGVPKTNGWGDALSVSCASVGNCTAGGEFEKSNSSYAGFVVSSTNGTWGQAQEVVFDNSISGPINYVLVNSVSCASSGNCAAVGKFGSAETFVLTSTNGVWGQATRVTFPAGVRNATPYDRLVQVSCTSVGNCTAVGNFRNATGTSSGPNEQMEAYTVTLTNGVWGQATPVVYANTVTQYTVPRSDFNSLSCNSPGNCTAVGKFKNSTGGYEMFVTTSNNGVWSQATPISFTSGVQPTQTADWYQGPMSISCASAGNCVVVGGFTNTALDFEAFTLRSTNGVWGQATPVSFATGVQHQSPYAELKSVSCPSVGNCVAAGYVKTNLGTEAFTTSLTNGVWADGRLAIFPAGVQNQPRTDMFYSISCPSVGNCTTGGFYRHQDGSYFAQTMESVNGVWDAAVPAVFGSGLRASSADERISSLSCPSAGNCAAVGYFNQTQLGYRPLAMLSTSSASAQTPASSTTVAASSGAVTTTTTTVTTISLSPTSSSNTAKALPGTGAQSEYVMLLVGVCLLSLGIAMRRRFS